MESVSQPDTQKDMEKEKEERIMARRRRVEAKLEAKHKAEAGEEPQEVSTQCLLAQFTLMHASERALCKLLDDVLYNFSSNTWFFVIQSPSTCIPYIGATIPA